MTNNLKELRCQFKKKQSELAQKLGIYPSTYNYKENGKSEFTASEIKKLQEIFNLTFNQIFLTTDSQNENHIKTA